MIQVVSTKPRPLQAIPAASTNQGFRFGHSMLGLGDHHILHFAFEFYGHTTYHGLVNPSNPIVQAMIARMLETEDYFFFAINPDQNGDGLSLALGDRRFSGPQDQPGTVCRCRVPA